MPRYPYIVKVGSLREFLKNIPSTGVPEKLTKEKLDSLGYKSSNDRPIPGILEFIGFLDSEHKPTDKYMAFRDKAKAGAVMASCLRTAYSDLFQQYPDAHNKDNEALRNFFSTGMKGGEAVLVNTVNTFRALCEFADFETAPVREETPKGLPTTGGKDVIRLSQETPGLTVNLNIQLTLPATEDSTIYDKIFQSLKKYLLER